MNFYKHHLGDYADATAHLTWDEDMAYTRLLRTYYRTESPIPVGKQYRLCRASTKKQKKAVDSIISEFFDEADNSYRNSRADQEIAAYQAQREVNQRVGKLGGRPPRNRIETESDTIRNPNQMPDIKSQMPDAISQNQNPDVTKSRSKSKPSLGVCTPQRGNGSGGTVETWEAYNNAYKHRYGVDAVRNARVNGQLAQLITRLGVIEAPAVAAFYVGHNRGLYVSAKHPINLLLRECEGLHTEWATNRMITDTDGKQADRTQSNFNSFAPLIEEARQREKNREK